MEPQAQNDRWFCLHPTPLAVRFVWHLGQPIRFQSPFSRLISLVRIFSLLTFSLRMTFRSFCLLYLLSLGPIITKKIPVFYRNSRFLCEISLVQIFSLMAFSLRMTSRSFYLLYLIGLRPIIMKMIPVFYVNIARTDFFTLGFFTQNDLPVILSSIPHKPRTHNNDNSRFLCANSRFL